MVCERDGCRHSLSDLRSAGPRKQRCEVLAGEATDFIEEWQKQLQGVPLVNLQASEHEDVVLVERPRSNAAVSFVPCLFGVSKSEYNSEEEDTSRMVSPRERFC